MEVKDILEKIRHQEDKKKELYFALEIGLEVAKSAVWSVDGDSIKVVAVGKKEKWEKEEDLLEAVDSSLSSAAEGLAPQDEAEEPNKVIFGLPSDWVEEEKIIPEKIKLLRDLSQKLELKPVGFVVITEAVVHYLKAIEGVPLTAILVGFSKKRMTLVLVRLGRINDTQVVQRSENLGDDVIEGLSRYEDREPFPARILLYNGDGDLENSKQDLLNYPWQEGKAQEKEVIFLHLPKVEVLPDDFDIKAVALAGGKEVARAAGISADFSREKEAEESLTDEESSQPEKKEDFLLDTDFGFVKNEDVLENKTILPKPEVPETFLSPATEVEKDETISPEPIRLKRESFFSRLKKRFRPRLRLPNFSIFSQVFSKFNFKNKPSLILVIVAVFLFMLAGATVFLYWYMPKASIILQVEPKKLEEKLEIKLDPNTEILDEKNLVLPAKTTEVNIKGEKSVKTTGTKLVGDKAKGTVKIINGTSQEKTFDSGTVLTSLLDLKFTLDDKVTVASQNALLEPGKANANVTASQIGSESNFASGTVFTIGNYSKSDYVAQNDNAFTGGSSREIQVVAEKDLTQLLTDLTKELQTQSTGELNSAIAPDHKLLEQSISSVAISKNYDKQVNDEADQAKLTLELKFKALTYSEEEMKNLLEVIVKKKIPDGYEYRSQQSTTDFSFEKLSPDGVAVFSVNFSANLVPQFDLEKIKNDLAGKLPSIAKTYLSNLSGVIGSEIKITPNLPARILTIPRQAKNIDIEIRVQ